MFFTPLFCPTKFVQSSYQCFRKKSPLPHRQLNKKRPIVWNYLWSLKMSQAHFILSAVLWSGFEKITKPFLISQIALRDLNSYLVVMTYVRTDAFETNLKFARIYLTYTGFAKFHNMVKLLINRRTYAPPTSHCNSKI